MNKDLEIVKALIKEMNEELKGGQKNLDVAAPFGKLTGADFAALRGKKDSQLEEKVDMRELEFELKRLKQENPGKKVTYIFKKDSPKGYVFFIDNKLVKENHEGTDHEFRGKKGVKKEVRFETPKSVEDLPEYDGLYYVGGFVDIDGSPWVSREEAEEILRNLTEGEDHEVSMANNSIDSIIWAAGELKKHLQGGERDIPAWIQDHITNAENYILQAAKNYHEYGAEEAPESDLGLTNEDLMSTLGGERPFGDSEMRKNIVEPNLGPDYDAYIMFQGPEGQYDKAKQKYVKDMAGWKQLYRSSSYQGNAYISPDGNVIKAAILSRGGIVGAIYVKKENEMSLQEMIKKVGSKYNVYSKKGKKLGSHPSKKKAKKQMAAIEISKQGK
jgi:hypothetical protein